MSTNTQTKTAPKPKQTKSAPIPTGAGAPTKTPAAARWAPADGKDLPRGIAGHILKIARKVADEKNQKGATIEEIRAAMLEQGFERPGGGQPWHPSEKGGAAFIRGYLNYQRQIGNAKLV